jgi:23S rRNA pseudouridine1911/1915/1917 synthase
VYLTGPMPPFLNPAVRLLPKDRDLNQPPEEVLLRVEGSFFRLAKEEVDIRLDQFLSAHLTWRSRSSIQKLIREGFVSLDLGKPDAPDGCGVWSPERRPGRHLRHGARVRVEIPPDLRIPLPEGPLGELEILYEDEAVLVVEKPAGIAVHPSGRHVNDTLIQRIHGHYAKNPIPRDGLPRLAHRIDRETSGIVLVGLKPAIHADLRRQFEEGSNDKFYLALVRGPAPGMSGSVTLPIREAHASAVRIKMTAAEDGLPARTDWRILEQVGPYSLVECQLFTGRQHQIRVHLAAIGLPLVGDKLYGPDEQLFIRASEGELTDEDRELLELPRQALHHHAIAFDHPVTGERLRVESPLPMDLRLFLDERR